MLILFLKLQLYTPTFLHLVLFSFHIFTFSTFPSFPFSYTFSTFSYSFSYSPSYISISFIFPYAFPSYFLTFPIHCLAVPKLILLYLLFHITILTVNIASCQATVPYCAILYLVIINFIGSSFKLLCNSALLCHYCAIVDHLLICLLL